MSASDSGRRPRFSIITPVFNPPAAAFRDCIESVLSQTYKDWEWCVADDASSAPHVEPLLATAEADPRVRVVRRIENGGIVAASNEAAAMAQGDFIVFLDNDDLLAADALDHVADVLSSVSDVDFVYSDEDKVAEDGTFYDRFWKPDWSPERLRGQNYCSHLSVIRSELFWECGGLRSGFDGSQDYDLVFRVTERARRIVHIPEVLYHWRAVAGSTALDFDAKPFAFNAAIRAIDDHLSRVGIPGAAEQAASGYYRVRRSVTDEPLVSIVIPTRGTRKRIWGQDICLLTNAVRSIVERSSYEHFEVVVVHDPDTATTVLEDLDDLLGDRLHLVGYRKPFDFSDKINRGVLASSGEVVVMLNDDTEVIAPDWIETLIGYLGESDIGLVGPMLYLTDGRVQSAGHHNFPTPMHLGAGAPSNDPGPFGMLSIAGERTGVTGACAALRREVFDEVGGLSAEFPRSFNDVDLAFKLIHLGYRIVWTPFAQLYHFESLSRDPRVTESEVFALYERWGWAMESEPYARGIDQWWTSMPI